LKFIELFGGVGGFRVGLERANSQFDCVWTNQFEPSTPNVQSAADVYRYHFGNKTLSNIDLNVILDEKKSIPNFELLTAGFPCQDFSVAQSLATSKGLEGNKGNLWYKILDVIDRKKPKYCLFENVNRLIQSPALERGRDFAYILASLNDRGYTVEWMVVDASEYGFPQRRKRVFFFCFKNNTQFYSNFKNKEDLLLCRTFPFLKSDDDELNFPFHLGGGSLKNVFKNFNPAPKGTVSAYKYKSVKKFLNYGICSNREYQTYDTKPLFDGNKKVLKDIILNEEAVDETFYVPNEDLKKWKKHKFGGEFQRKSKSGFKYIIKIGKMSLYDDLAEPSRTILTAEGGKSASRSKHLIKTNSKQSRRLTPIELERLNMFPDNFTKFGKNFDNNIYELLPTKRAFLMGNALVTGCVTKIGKTLFDRLSH
jgi:DNA (cytosine-5)-methyltransferase 1